MRLEPEVGARDPVIVDADSSSQGVPIGYDGARHAVRDIGLVSNANGQPGRAGVGTAGSPGIFPFVAGHLTSGALRAAAGVLLGSCRATVAAPPSWPDTSGCRGAQAISALRRISMQGDK